jgi:hypothetical protein
MRRKDRKLTPNRQSLLIMISPRKNTYTWVVKRYWQKFITFAEREKFGWRQQLIIHNS